MESDSYKQILNLFQLALSDEEYARMHQRLKQMEGDLSELTIRLTEEEQDIIWGYVCLSDEMNWRMVKILSDRIKKLTDS